MPYSTLLPIFAREILHGGPQTLGLLMGAAGIGALAGALFLASRRDLSSLDIVIALAAMTFGGGLIVFSLSRVLWVSLGLMVVSGAG